MHFYVTAYKNKSSFIPRKEDLVKNYRYQEISSVNAIVAGFVKDKESIDQQDIYCKQDSREQELE